MASNQNPLFVISSEVRCQDVQLLCLMYHGVRSTAKFVVRMYSSFALGTVESGQPTSQLRYIHVNLYHDHYYYYARGTTNTRTSMTPTTMLEIYRGTSVQTRSKNKTDNNLRRGRICELANWLLIT